MDILLKDLPTKLFLMTPQQINEVTKLKKFVSVFLLSLILFSMCSFNTFATDENSDTSIINLNNGAYLVVEISEININRATNTKSGTKSITYKNDNNESMWKATITGTFTYTGSSATCTKASINYNVYADNWKMKEAISSKSGNKAIGDVTAKRYLLGIPVETVNQTFYLTCSATGTLS